MTMVAKQYLEAIARLLQEIETEELGRIQALADRIAEAVRSGGLFYVFDNGHMLNTELFNRAGGLALIAPLIFTRPGFGSSALRLGGTPAWSDDGRQVGDDDLVLARMAVRRAGVRAGDVVLLGSVSGRSPAVVEMAREASVLGALTVALTALGYSTLLPASHPSGQRLFEAVDVVLDTHTGEGDAEVTLEGLSDKILPSSGISAALVAWCLVGEVFAALLARGIEPTVFRSINYPDGPARHREALDRYRRLGY
ncbi:MAG: sugar isomerase domain-containing protein [Clostridia bacterium]